MTTQAPGFDLDDAKLLFRPDVIEDPTALYGYLRKHAPVWELPGTNTFVVSTAALLTEAIGRHEDFSSNLNSLLFTGDDGNPAVFDMTHLGPGIHVLATADPPIHTVHRKLTQPLFTPGAVERLAGFVDDAARALVTATIDGDQDYNTGVAEPLPVQVIAKMVGIPDGDVAMLAPLVLQSNDLLAGIVDGASMATSGAASMEVNAYLGNLVETWPQGSTSNTACDVLAAAARRGEITVSDAQGMIIQLLGAGTETTTGLIGRTGLHLATHPDLQQTVRTDLSLVPALLEEMLRFDGPFRFHYRAATRDTELGGVAIPKGSRVLLMWAAANLDADFFDHANEFDLYRQLARSHFAFGRGMHFCIGAPLARLEARYAVEHLLRATKSFGLDPNREPSYRPSIFLRRMAHLPLAIETY